MSTCTFQKSTKEPLRNWKESMLYLIFQQDHSYNHYSKYYKIQKNLFEKVTHSLDPFPRWRGTENYFFTSYTSTVLIPSLARMM
jgi:hypothetical protein